MNPVHEKVDPKGSHHSGRCPHSKPDIPGVLALLHRLISVMANICGTLGPL